jgi:chromosome segregation ATPase
MPPSSVNSDIQQQITRLEIIQDSTNKSVEQLLKLVRDGNGTAPLVVRVQGLESGMDNIVDSHDDIKARLTKLDQKLENQHDQVATNNREMVLLRQEFHNFLEEFKKKQAEQDKVQFKRRELVWGGVVTMAVSLALNWLLIHSPVGQARAVEISHPSTIEIPTH